MDKLSVFINKYKPQIGNCLKTYLDKKAQQQIPIPFQADVYQKLLKFAASGKLLRGVLVILTGNAFGVKPESTIQIAAAVELMHSGFLIHDDILDDDLIRRGHKTIFAQYKDEAVQGVRNKEFYGQAMAICAGDLAFFLAFELISEKSGFGNISFIINKFSSEIQKVGAAEMGDFHFGITEEEPGLEQIIEIYRFKSARYTFSLPLAIGAILGNADTITVSALEKLGEDLGIIFQLKDDELGLFGTEEEIGKPVGSDIKQNKKTVLRSLLYKRANLTQKESLKAIFGNEHITQADVEHIKNMVVELGVKEEVDNMAREYSQTARTILSEIDIPHDFRATLEELINYNLARIK